MEKEDKRGVTCSCSCMGLLLWLIFFCLVISYCQRKDKKESIINTSIEWFHDKYNYADSVWHKNDTTKQGKDDEH